MTVVKKIQLPDFLVDQAGRQRMSLPIPLGDYKLVNDRLPLFFDTEENGATVGYNSVKKSHQMTTNTNSQWAIVQTFMYHNYFAGKAQNVEFTSFDFGWQSNIIKRSGYFRSNEVTPFQSNFDGFFIESNSTKDEHYLKIYNNGTLVKSIAQSEWNVDKLDGTGPSGVTIDWNKFNVFQANFLWLGGTGLKLSLVNGDVLYTLHNYVHANSGQADKLIFSSPNQPIRHEIHQVGSGSGEFNPVCSTVFTEGSTDSANIGSVRSTGTGSAGISCSTAETEYVIKAVRLKDAYKDVTLDLLDVYPFSNDNNKFYTWRLLLNPTITGGSLTWEDTLDSAIQTANGDGTLVIDPASIGYELSGGFGVGRSAADTQVRSARKLGGKIDGTRDIVVLTITPLAGTTALNGFGRINYKEFV